MKIEGYEQVYSLIMPEYWYEEGEEKEEYWTDSQNLDYYKFSEEKILDTEPQRKWWTIGLCKPKGVKITKENEEEVVRKLCKWLVVDSYTNYKPYKGDEDWDHYEWDFKNHCVIEN